MHCSYKLKFFVVRDHLWDGNSLPQLQSSWLVSTRGSRASRYTEGVARRIATRNAEIESRVRGGPALFITKLMMTLRLSPGTLRDPMKNQPFDSLVWGSVRLAALAQLYLPYVRRSVNVS